MLKRLSNRNKNLVLGIVQTVLAVLALLGFILSIRFFESPTATKSCLFNAGVDVMGLFVCAVLFFGCMGDIENVLSTSNIRFVFLIVLNSFAFFNNEMCWHISGIPKYADIYIFLNGLTKIYDFLFVLLFYRYVASYMKFKGKYVKGISRWVQIMIIPAALLIVLNHIFGFCFTVDADGNFVKQSLYFLVDIYLVIVVPPTLFLIIRSKESRDKKIVSYIFIAIPIVHYIITGGAHGYATQYGSTLVALIILYCRIFNDRSKKLFATKTELNLATDIQKAMVPNVFPPYPDRNEFEIYASMNPAKEVGGDFYDYFMVDDDHLCLVMADVSDKGVPAALFMMVAKTIIQSCAMLGKSAAETLDKTNEAICSKNPYGMFVTVWIGILEISTGKLSAANAGHEYPIIKSPNGNFELFKDKHGLFVGGVPGTKYTEYDIQLEPGSKLFVYTDGIPEAKNKVKEMFGTKRMLETLNQDVNSSPEEIIGRIFTSVEKFVNGADQFDDLTMLCFEYKG